MTERSAEREHGLSERGTSEDDTERSAEREHGLSERGTSKDDMTRATLLTWTIIRAPPPGFPKDRIVGLLEFPDGSRRFAVASSERGLTVGAAVDVGEGEASTFTPV